MSAWRDQYQTGSFRGAAFRTESHEGSGGRRNATHEMPGRDEPVVEDLGRRARGFSVECHVIGDDYRTGRDALLDALEAAGPGQLIHPWKGAMSVVVNDFTYTENTEEGGICRFSIQFAEAGAPVSAPVAAATGQDAATAADAAEEAAPEKLQSKFSIDGAAAFVEEASADLVKGMAEVSKAAAVLQGGIGPGLLAYVAGLGILPDSMSRLLRDGLLLGTTISGMVRAVAALRPSGAAQRSPVAALTKMLDWTPAPVTPRYETPQRLQQAQNQLALVELFRTVTAAELCRAAAGLTYASYEDAIAVRDAITGRLETLALDAADNGRDDEADTYDALRRALVRDIAVRGASLSRVYSLSLAATEPALVLGHRLYGGARLTGSDPETRALAIAARNHVPHPGFLPGGVTLELLTRAYGEAA